MGTNSWVRVCPVLLAPTAQPPPQEASQVACSSKAESQREGRDKARPPEASNPLMATRTSVVQCPSALWESWSPLPMTTVSTGSIPMSKVGWHSGTHSMKEPESREGTAPSLSGGGGPTGGGLRSPLLPWVSDHRLTGKQGDRGIFLHISKSPQASRTQSLPPHGTCGLQAARPQPQGPL